MAKELRLASVSVIESANQFPLETYPSKMNGKFSRPDSDPADAHIPLGNAGLNEILRFEHDRAASDSYVVRFERRLFQILKTNKTLPRPKNKVIVRIRWMEVLNILWKRKSLLVEELAKSEQGQNAPWQHGEKRRF
jgi:hypothetical protein